MRAAGVDGKRVRAVVRKELREYRRNRFIVYAMAATPLVFLGTSLASLLSLSSSVSATVVRNQVGLAFLWMLIVPAVVPATIAAYSIVGEREQATLEPLLTTPIRRDELILGKAAAAVIPSVAAAYALFAVVVGSVRLGAVEKVAAAIWQPHWLLVELLFVPLIAVWSIWVGITASTRSTDVRVAQQLAGLGSLPPLALTSLMTFQILKPTVALAFELGLALAAVDVVAWRLVSALVDRERLITA
jgi:ABC-type Na+ efflux pump permease subunit